MVIIIFICCRRHSCRTSCLAQQFPPCIQYFPRCTFWIPPNVSGFLFSFSQITFRLCASTQTNNFHFPAHFFEVSLCINKYTCQLANFIDAFNDFRKGSFCNMPYLSRSPIATSLSTCQLRGFFDEKGSPIVYYLSEPEIDVCLR